MKEIFVACTKPFVYMVAIVLFVACVKNVSYYVRKSADETAVAVRGNNEIELLSEGYTFLYNPFKKVYIFPFFENIKKFQDNEDSNESIIFYSSDGVEVKAAVNLVYEIILKDVNQLLKKYPHGMDDIVLLIKNVVEDAVEKEGAKYTAEELYIEKENEFFGNVKKKVINDKRLVDIEIPVLYEQKIIVSESVRDELNKKKQTIISKLRAASSQYDRKINTEIEISVADKSKIRCAENIRINKHYYQLEMSIILSYLLAMCCFIVITFQRLNKRNVCNYLSNL